MKYRKIANTKRNIQAGGSFLTRHSETLCRTARYAKFVCYDEQGTQDENGNEETLFAPIPYVATPVYGYPGVLVDSAPATTTPATTTE